MGLLVAYYMEWNVSKGDTKNSKEYTIQPWELSMTFHSAFQESSLPGCYKTAGYNTSNLKLQQYAFCSTVKYLAQEHNLQNNPNQASNIC